MVGEKKNEFQNLIMVSTFLKERKKCSISQDSELLIYSVKTKQDLLCRLSLSYIYDREYPLQYLFEALSIAIEEEDNGCAKAIAWFITRTFFLANRVLLNCIIDIWPAFKESSSKVTIVIELVSKINDHVKTPAEHFPVEIIYSIDEDVYVHCTNSDKNKSNTHLHFADNKQITGLSAQNLFVQHSKLTLICKSSFLQRGIEKQCVHLFCKVKGLIPAGENPFPKLLCSLPTKVLEGSPDLMTNLRVGDMIGTDEFKKGTLGGFVKVRGDKAFLTCLHVFLSPQKLAADHISLDDDKPWYVKCYPASVSHAASSTSSFICGRIRDIAFETNKCESTSIDAALINLQEEVDICPTDYVVNQNAGHYGLLGKLTYDYRFLNVKKSI